MQWSLTSRALERYRIMPLPFRFGVVGAYAPTRSAWITTARRAEELGYATLLVPDRTSVGILAPLVALSVAAGATTSLRLGPYVLCNEYRHPVLVAREAATLDLLSEGRFELGLGAGVGPAEFQQMGIPFASPGTRVGPPGRSPSIVETTLHSGDGQFHRKILHGYRTERKHPARPEATHANTRGRFWRAHAQISRARGRYHSHSLKNGAARCRPNRCLLRAKDRLDQRSRRPALPPPGTEPDHL